MSDIDARIAKWYDKLATTDDPAEQADIREMIATLEAKRDATRTHEQTIDTNSGVAIAGDVFGAVTNLQGGQTIIQGDAQTVLSGTFLAPVYLNGYRSEDQQRILAAYVARLRATCNELRLQALSDSRDGGMRGQVTLQAVYTQVATTTLRVREEWSADQIAAMDWDAWLKAARQDEHALVDPSLHLRIRRHDSSAAPTGRSARRPGHGDDGRAWDERAIDLATVTAEELEQLTRDATQVQVCRPLLATEAMAADRRLVLLGEPGSGKSTALRALALSLAAVLQHDPRHPSLAAVEGLPAERLIPVYAPLLPLATTFAQQPSSRGRAIDLWNYLARDLNGVKTTNESPLPSQYPGTAEAIAQELQHGRVILLLDGLDEVAGAESRRAVVEAVADFAEKHPTCRIVVACRVRAYEGPQNAAWQLPGWPTATLAGWSPAQMDAFIGAWYQAAAPVQGLSETQRQDRTTALRAALRQRADLRRLGARPLLLTIMALVHLNRDLPEDRASLYRVCIEKLLAEWEKRGKDSSDYGSLTEYIGLVGRDVQALLPLLQQAAFTAHEAAEAGALGRIGKDRLRLLVMNALAVLGHSNPHGAADRFLVYTDHRAGLIQATDAGDAYAFPHQTFQEYLAGVQLVGQDSFVDAVLARQHDDRWETPIQLALGHLLANTTYSLISDLFFRLLEQDARSAEQRHRDIVWAATLAVDLGAKRLEATNPSMKRAKADLTHALVEVLSSVTLPAKERVRAGMLLGYLGDPRPGVCDVQQIPFVEFAGGPFQIGNTKAEYQAIIAAEKRNQMQDEAKRGYKDTLNTHVVTVRRFALARYPVTNAQWAIFMAEDGYNPEQPWWDAAGRAWLLRDDAATPGLEPWQQRQHKHQPEFWDDDRVGRARTNHPVVGISWYEAMAFATWLTGYLQDGHRYCLPSELEWEYAARGSERRMYPWGKAEPDGERANFDQTHGGTSAVGCFPAGATPAELHNLDGNVLEWTRSEYRPYPYDPDDGREDGADPAEKRFTVRGGSWYDLLVYLRASNRFNISPDNHDDDIGVRLARHSSA